MVFGKAAGFNEIIDGEQLTGSDGFILDGAADNDLAGNASISGDVNGDGFDDMIMGAHGDWHGGSTNGSSYVMFGKDSGFDTLLDLFSLDGINGFHLDGTAAYEDSVMLHGFIKELSGSLLIPLCGQQEINRLALLVYGTIQIFPDAFGLGYKLHPCPSFY